MIRAPGTSGGQVPYLMSLPNSLVVFLKRRLGNWSGHFKPALSLFLDGWNANVCFNAKIQNYSIKCINYTCVSVN